MKNIDDHVSFIWLNEDVKYSHKTSTNGSNTIDLFVIVSKEGESREYSAITYLDLIIQGYYKKIDKMTSIKSRIIKVYDTKADIIHNIRSMKDYMERVNAPFTNYDFERLLRQIDSVIDKIRLELEVDKYELERKKLKIETAWYKEPIIIVGFGIAVFTFLTQTCNTKKDQTHQLDRKNHTKNTSSSIHKLEKSMQIVCK